MKSRILFLLLILISSASFGQSATKLYYSVDSKGWATIEERDEHELQLERQMIDDLMTIIKNDNDKLDDCKAVKERIEAALDGINSIRGMDAGISQTLTPTLLEAIQSVGVEVKLSKAVDNELFGMKEIADYANLHINQYLFYSQWVQATLSEKTHTSLLNSDLAKYNQAQLNNIETSKNALSIKLNLIAKALVAKADEEDAKSTKAKTSYLAQNGYLFYSLDGREYKTQAERDLQNQLLKRDMEESLKELGYTTSDDGGDSYLMTNLVSTMFTEINILYNSMSTLDNKENYADLAILVNKTAPGIDLGIYQAKNKEIFFLQEMADAYDRICTIYTLTYTILHTNKELKKANEKLDDESSISTINLVSDIKDQQDADGKNITALLSEANELLGKVLVKYQLMGEL